MKGGRGGRDRGGGGREEKYRAGVVRQQVAQVKAG